MNSDINYIIQQAIKGDKNYQEILLKKLNPLIYKNIYKYFKPNNPLIEDLLQEGYIVILESLKNYDKKRNVHFLQYVKITLYYFYKNYYKKTYKYRTLSIETLKSSGRELESNNISHLDRFILKEEKDTLYKCINKLSEKDKKILHLYYFEQLSMQEISEELNIAYRTAINLKSSAVKKLRRMMTKKLLFQ